MRISATSTFLTRSLVRGRMREREGHEKGHEEIWKNLGNRTKSDNGAGEKMEGHEMRKKYKYIF